MYKLTFSSKINDDIIAVISYIKNTLKAPMEAEKYVSELKKSYEKLRENPFARPLVHKKKPMKYFYIGLCIVAEIG